MTRNIDNQDNLNKEAIAIVGMACLYPGARNVREFWRNILGGVDSVTDPPPGAWDPAIYYDPSSLETDRIYCKRGGYIEDLATFDPLPFGVPPKDVGGEPDQWLALKLARDALLDAGYADAPDEIKRRTAVILGRGLYPNAGSVNAVQHTLIVTQTLDVIRSLQPDLPDQDLDEIRRQLKQSLPTFGADTAPALTPNMITGRIANRLDLMGPNYTVDAACASSLVAIKMASRELLNGDCDIAIAGGSQVWTSMPILGVFGQMGALSHSEQIRPFDKNADGTILGEGIGMVVLRRLSDAERNKDRIYAVVRGVGISSDGRASGLMAPRAEGQVLAMRRAYEDAGVSPDTIELIEAHGTGTPVGDRVEVQSMTEVFGVRGGELPNIAIGSVKSMIGHTMPAAGAAGLIKTALALHHKVLPLSLHCDEPNPDLELDKTRFYVNNSTRPWISGRDHPRRAAVSAFGFGGINGHVILEEYAASNGTDKESEPRLQEHLPDWDSELFVLTGGSREQLIDGTAELVAGLSAVAEGDGGQAAPRLVEIANALAADWHREHVHRLSIVATSVADLLMKAKRAHEKLSDPLVKQIRETGGIYYTSRPLRPEGKVAFLFPGEGSQYINMLSQLALNFPEARSAFDEMDALRPDYRDGLAPSDFLMVPTNSSQADIKAANQQLWTMDGAVSSVLAADEAVLRVVRSLGIEVDGVAGHSSGEYAALRTAGVFRSGGRDGFADLAKTLVEVHEASQKEDSFEPAILLACGTDRESAQSLLSLTGADGFVAMDNCPNQVVIVARASAKDRLLTAAKDEAIIVEPLKFDRPYHTPLFVSYSERLRGALDETRFTAPSLPIYSCATGAMVGQDPTMVADLVAHQWSQVVEFRRTVERMYDDGYRIFVEIGPGNHLTAFVEDILRGKPFNATASNVQRHSDLTQLNHMAGSLFAQGVNVDVAALSSRRLRTDSGGKVSQTEVTLVTGFTPMKVDASKLPSVRSAGLSQPTDNSLVAPPQPSGAASDVPTTEQSLILLSNPGEEEPALSSQSSLPSANGNHSPAPVSQDGMAQVAHRFLETMDHFLQVQERVMNAYLRSTNGGSLSEPSEEAGVWKTSPISGYAGFGGNGNGASSKAAPTSVQVPVPRTSQYVETAPAAQLINGTEQKVSVREEQPEKGGKPKTAVTEAPAPLDRSDEPSSAPDQLAVVLPSLLRQIVSDRTGYPAEIIDVNADLEADLGIDSIKRVEILGTLRNQYEALRDVNLEQLTTCRTLQQIVDVVVGEAGGRPFDLPSADVTEDRSAEGTIADHPLLGRFIRFEPGRRVVARMTIDPEQSPWLREHTIGRDVSVHDETLMALPVMPLALSLEFLAQAAACLSPGRVVTRIEAIRAKRWIEFGDGPQTIEIRASHRDDSPSSYACQVMLDSPEGMTPAVEANVILEAAYPARSGTVLPNEAGVPSGFAPDDLYFDIMYHGSTWQAVQAIVATGSGGITARLSVPGEFPFRADEAPFTSLLDPVALDAAGQLLGFWTAEHFEDGRLVFPISVEAIEFFGLPSIPGDDLTCRVAIRYFDDLRVSADFEVMRADALLFRAIGWLDRRFYMPLAAEAVVRPRSLPDLAIELDEAELGLNSNSSTLYLKFDIALEDETGILRRIWTSRIRTRSERERIGLVVNNVRDLVSEHLAKEAVCRLLRKAQCLSIRPADVELQTWPDGQLHAVGPWLPSLSAQPVVWLALEGTTVIAAASLDSRDAEAQLAFVRRIVSEIAGTPSLTGIDVKSQT